MRLDSLNRTKKGFHPMDRGFTLLELVVVIVLIGTIGAIAVPSFTAWLPRVYLRSAARDVYLNLQNAKLQAIKENKTVEVRFESTGEYYYFDADQDDVYDTGEKRIDLANYGYGIEYGPGKALVDWKGNAITSNTDHLISFSSRGTANGGSVYLQNSANDIAFGIRAYSSGGVTIRRYNGKASDKTNWID